jgi:uncharacterized phage protein (TIGR02218 family)
MKTATNNVTNLLNGDPQSYRWAEIYRLQLLDGSNSFYTSMDQDISWAGYNWNSNDLLIKRGRIIQSIGLEVDELEITVFPRENANLAGVPWIQAVRNGVLDGAILHLARIFYDGSWNTANQIGGIDLFRGNVSDIDPIGRSSAVIAVKNLYELLNVPWPRFVYQAPCMWRLYDAGCGANKAAFTVSGTVSGNGNNTISFNTNLPQANNYFDQGVIAFTSGNLSGVRRTVKSFAANGNIITVISPLSSSPTNGVGFNAYPGCDHTEATCNNTFNNHENFRGCPFIPTAETGV